jgi:hypothetical protein
MVASSDWHNIGQLTGPGCSGDMRNPLTADDPPPQETSDGSFDRFHSQS